jgi:hypothetical protein
MKSLASAVSLAGAIATRVFAVDHLEETKKLLLERNPHSGRQAGRWWRTRCTE